MPVQAIILETAVQITTTPQAQQRTASVFQDFMAHQGYLSGIHGDVYQLGQTFLRGSSGESW